MEKILKVVLHDWKIKNTFYIKERLQKSLYRFIGHESFSGILLLICVVLAMTFANIPSTSDFYFSLWESKIKISFNNFENTFSLINFINDFLMSFFFLMVGLEMKREILYGELMGFKKMSFSMFAALGGIIAPIIIFILFNHNTDLRSGFGIAMSTDTAFALGVIFLLGKRIPSVIKIFLVTLAVADDLGAILIIAIFYTKHIDFFWVLMIFVNMIYLIYLNYKDTKYISLYLIGGFLLWYSTLQSGIHPTISAVLLAFCIPGKTKLNQIYYEKMIKELTKLNLQKEIHTQETPQTKSFFTLCKEAFCEFFNPHQKKEMDIQEMSRSIHVLDCIGKYSYYAKNPLLALEFMLQPICAYFIVPLFAFANGGVKITNQFDFFSHPLMWGIFFGLIVGKPIGISIMAYLSEKFKISTRPKGLSYQNIVAVGFLAGIGFTMSMFVATLAYEDQDMINLAKLSIIFTSFIATIIGIIALFISTQKTALQLRTKINEESKR